jgi:hypothetical protein
LECGSNHLLACIKFVKLEQFIHFQGVVFQATFFHQVSVSPQTTNFKQVHPSVRGAYHQNQPFDKEHEEHQAVTRDSQKIPEKGRVAINIA